MRYTILAVLSQTLTSPPIASGDPTFSNAVIQGNYKCVLTAYGLLPKANQPFAVTATANLTVTADGNGKLTSGPGITRSMPRERTWGASSR